jgi:hypothetical protein
LQPTPDNPQSNLVLNIWPIVEPPVKKSNCVSWLSGQGYPADRQRRVIGLHCGWQLVEKGVLLVIKISKTKNGFCFSAKIKGAKAFGFAERVMFWFRRVDM